MLCVVPAKDPLIWNMAMSQATSSALRAGHTATHVRYWATTGVITKPESLPFASWMHISQARLPLAPTGFVGGDQVAMHDQQPVENVAQSGRRCMCDSFNVHLVFFRASNNDKIAQLLRG